jgi:hypothetical protein
MHIHTEYYLALEKNEMDGTGENYVKQHKPDCGI